MRISKGLIFWTATIIVVIYVIYVVSNYEDTIWYARGIESNRERANQSFELTRVAERPNPPTPTPTVFVPNRYATIGSHDQVVADLKEYLKDKTYQGRDARFKGVNCWDLYGNPNSPWGEADWITTYSGFRQDFKDGKPIWTIWGVNDDEGIPITKWQWLYKSSFEDHPVITKPGNHAPNPAAEAEVHKRLMKRMPIPEGSLVRTDLRGC